MSLVCITLWVISLACITGLVYCGLVKLFMAILSFGKCQKILNVDLELQITNRAIVQDVITSHDSYFCVDISVFLSFCFFQWHVSGELKNEELCPDFGSLLMIVCWAFLLLLMWMSSFACLRVVGLLLVRNL